MTIVKIHKQNKNQLKAYTNGAYDEIINKLIDDIEHTIPIHEIDYSTVSSIKLKEDTIDRLSAYRLTDGESYENIIVRMLILAQSLNTDVD